MAEKQAKSSDNGDYVAVNASKPANADVQPRIGFPSCRHIFIAMSFFGFINVYSLRVNLSVALVAMIDTEYVRQLEAHPSSSLFENATHGVSLFGNSTYGNETVTAAMVADNGEPQCESHSAGNTTVAKAEHRSGGFKWDSKKQGAILAAFFYGYATTQLLGGTLSQRFGGKMVLLIGVLVTAVLTVLTPVLTVAGEFPALIALRVIEGIAEGVSFPAMNGMLSKWAPPMLRSTMATTIYAGSTMGTVITMPISGFLCQWLGWESVFYVFGAIGIAWSVMWFFLVYDSPGTHPRISKEEREYLETSMGQKVQNKGSFHVPWCAVAKSVPLYALAVAHFCSNYGYYMLLTCLPQYLRHILKFDISSNGIIAGAPYALTWFFITGSGIVSDILRSRHIVSTTNVRKFCMIFGFLVPGACLVATGYINCNTTLAVTLIFIAIGVSGISFGGWSVNHLDLAPPYAGTLMGLTNTLATFSGFIGPSIVGVITYKNQTRAAWRTVFYIAAAIYVFGSIVYGFFGSGEIQPWALSPKTEEVQELNVTADNKPTKGEEKNKDDKGDADV